MNIMTDNLFNKGTIVEELHNIITINKKSLVDIDNLIKNLSRSAPEISDYRFWNGHETGNWPGLYEILVNHFKDISKKTNLDKYNESIKVKNFYIKSYLKYKKTGFN